MNLAISVGIWSPLNRTASNVIKTVLDDTGTVLGLICFFLIYIGGYYDLGNVLESKLHQDPQHCYVNVSPRSCCAG